MTCPMKIKSIPSKTPNNIDNVIPMGATQKKQFTNTGLLVEAALKEDGKVIFGE